MTRQSHRSSSEGDFLARFPVKRPFNRHYRFRWSKLRLRSVKKQSGQPYVCAHFLLSSETRGNKPSTVSHQNRHLSGHDMDLRDLSFRLAHYG